MPLQHKYRQQTCIGNHRDVYKLQDIKKALQASRLEQSAAQSVVAQGLKHQATQGQAGTSKPIRKLVSDPYNESDSGSSDSGED